MDLTNHKLRDTRKEFCKGFVFTEYHSYGYMWVDALPFSSCPGHPSAVEVWVGCVILVGKDPPE